MKLRDLAVLSSLVALAACVAPTGSDEAPEATGRGESASTITLPKLSGDCLEYIRNDGSRAPVDIGALGLEAGNCSDGSSICLLLNSTAQPNFAMLMLDLPIDLYEAGRAIDLPSSIPSLKLSVHVRNTQYVAQDTTLGERLPRGSITVTTLDLDQGNVDIRFDGVALGGGDAVYAGALRCSLEGTLSIRGLRRKELGESCTKDHDCGGGFSGRMCGDSFACTRGCHDDDGCPIGSLCSSGQCSANAGANSDEISICQEVCHDRTFFKCNEDEAACKSACASAARARVRSFIECNDRGRGDCKAGCEAMLGP